MSSKSLLAKAIGLASLAIVTVAVINPDSPFVSNLPFAHSGATNALSGLPGGDGPVLVVKIDDTVAAHPQIGLEDADIVYIEQVEGGLTRLAAVYSSVIPQRIGPVRSARISDIDLLSQFGKVGFAYSGVQKKMRPVINGANLFDLGAQSHSATIYTTDPSRTPPYAMVLRADLLMDFVKEKGLSLAKAQSIGWNFGDAPQGGKKVQSVHISWPASSYDIHWDSSTKRWLLDHRYQPNIAESGTRLSADTFVIQNVSITNSIYHDKVGGITPFSATVGSGTGYIMRDGKAFSALWNRPRAEEGTRWTTLTGEEIRFKAGRIWVALTDKKPIFTTASADATTSSSK